MQLTLRVGIVLVQQKRQPLGGHAGERMGILVLVALCAAVTGCSPPSSEPDTPDERYDAELTSLIGEADGDPDYLFGRVVGVAVDGEVVYVADAIGSTVRAYDLQGRFIGTVGVEGDGPGEFQYLLGVDIGPDGSLWVRGAFRLTEFATSSSAPFADSLVRTVPLGSPNPDRDVRGRGGDGLFYGPSYRWEQFERRGYYYLVYDRSGAVGDTIHVPPFPDPESTGRANYPVSAQGGRNVDGINRAPFEARPSWDILPDGSIWFSAGDAYDVIRVGPGGDTLAAISRDLPDRPVPPTERLDSLNAFNERLDSVPVPLSEVRGMSSLARRRELPRSLPAVLGLSAGADGRLLVRRWDDAGRSVFDLFDVDGSFQGMLRLAGSLKTSPAPVLTGDVLVGVLADPTTGVERIGVFDVSRR